VKKRRILPKQNLNLEKIVEQKSTYSYVSGWFGRYSVIETIRAIQKVHMVQRHGKVAADIASHCGYRDIIFLDYNKLMKSCMG